MTRTNKRMLAIFVSLIVITLIVVMFTAVFVLRRVVFEVVGDVELTQEQAEDLRASMNISYGTSIFNINTSAVVANIERVNPTIGVASIEVRAPQRLVITIFHRTPMFLMLQFGEDGISPGDGALLLCSEFKVLSDTAHWYAHDPNIIRVLGMNPGNPTVGEFLSDQLGYRLLRLRYIGQGIQQQELQGRVRQINVEHETYAFLLMESGSRLRITGRDHIVQQVAEAYFAYDYLIRNTGNTGEIRNPQVLGVWGWRVEWD